jgi:hypothetical protein
MAYWHLQEKSFGTVWDDLGCFRLFDVPVLFPPKVGNPRCGSPHRGPWVRLSLPACLEPADRIVGPPAFDQNPEVQADPLRETAMQRGRSLGCTPIAWARAAVSRAY